jgi:hypothetical protein
MNRVSLSSANGALDSPDPWPEMVAAGMVVSPLAGEPGHGGTAVLRRVSPRLQQLRGPYTITAGLAAYEQHLGLPVFDSPA